MEINFNVGSQQLRTVTFCYNVNGDEATNFRCSVCGCFSYPLWIGKYNYCPNCGSVVVKKNEIEGEQVERS